jgi:5-methylcytosine-specific restriction endonuclease McrA
MFEYAQVTTPGELVVALRELRMKRRTLKRSVKADGRQRGHLTHKERERILQKTGNRCHLCGGQIDGAWQADHVLALSGGGRHATDNYLPAHALCNNYRWDYLPDEFQFTLKLGVWARTQIEHDTGIGREIAEGFLKAEARRVRRRKA